MTPGLALAPPDVHVRREGDAIYLASPLPFSPSDRTLGDLFRRSAARAPTRDFLVERRADGLRRVTWAAAMERAEAIAGWLHGRGDSAVCALTANSVDHALVMLGCFLAGVPFVPVSAAYSQVSEDFEKLRVVLRKVRPSVVFAETEGARGLDVALELSRATAIYPSSHFGTTSRPLPTVAPEAVAKILFTSGSTGFPKGVPNTHRMLVANQEMIAALWPFLGEGEPPTLVDWLPWSHTFGGNHNFNMVLAHGGTLFVDDGRPPTIERSLRDLREMPPTLYFNVPAGYAALVPRLEADAELARAFFSRLRVAFYAAAALPADLWTRFVALAERHAPAPVFMTTAWGSTETSPLATSAHFPLASSGNIGLPAPGVTLKLVPNGDKTEVRVRGPSVMSGYLEEPALSADAFDDEGFYKMGDAVRFADPSNPKLGLVFDGRVAEDFKLASGTWVSVSHVRTGLVGLAGGVLADVVVCGQDRDELAILAWPSVAGGRALAGDRPLGELARSAEVRERVVAILRDWNAHHPSTSTRIARALLLETPPSIDAGEITDKGYTNQRATLTRRADDVARLYAPERDPAVLEA